MKTPEDEEFERIEAESGWRKRQIALDQKVENSRELGLDYGWVGLTEDDRVLIKHDANFNQFMTAGEYADRVQQLTEARLKDLNT